MSFLSQVVPIIIYRSSLINSSNPEGFRKRHRICSVPLPSPNLSFPLAIVFFIIHSYLAWHTQLSSHRPLWGAGVMQAAADPIMSRLFKLHVSSWLETRSEHPQTLCNHLGGNYCLCLACSLTIKKNKRLPRSTMYTQVTRRVTSASDF